MATASEMPLRVALIGGGKISEQHLIALSRVRNVKLAAVCDLSPALGQYIVERFGVERAFTDYRAMLSEVKPDVVHVLTPGHTHVAMVTDCLNAGSHAFVEKPIALSRSDFHALWALAERQGRRIMEDHNYRFNDPVLAIERLIASGQIGEVEDVEVRIGMALRAAGGRYTDENLPSPSHRLPCGAIHEFITHMTYLLLRFLGGFDRVTAAWNNHGGGTLFKFDDLDAMVMCGPRHGRLRFSCRTGPDTFGVVVRGSEGWAQTDLYQPHVRVVKPRRGGQLSPFVNHWANGVGLIRAGFTGLRDKVLTNTTYQGLYRIVDRYYAGLRGDGAMPVTFDDMDRCLALIEALLDPVNRVDDLRGSNLKATA